MGFSLKYVEGISLFCIYLFIFQCISGVNGGYYLKLRHVLCHWESPLSHWRRPPTHRTRPWWWRQISLGETCNQRCIKRWKREVVSLLFRMAQHLPLWLVCFPFLFYLSLSLSLSFHSSFPFFSSIDPSGRLIKRLIYSTVAELEDPFQPVRGVFSQIRVEFHWKISIFKNQNKYQKIKREKCVLFAFGFGEAASIQSD